jgi:hypothetical protein
MGLKHPPHLAKADASARASSLAFSRESWAAVTISAPSMRQSSRLTIVAVCGTPPPRAARSACVRRPSSVALTKTLVSPESGIKKPSYRGHLPVVIRKAGLNGPPGLGKPGREPFQLWSINRRPQTHARPPRFLVRARSAYLGPRSANFSSKPERGRSCRNLLCVLAICKR